jgi:hypothetical protein
MNNSKINTLLLACMTLLVAGAGYYLHAVRHPAQMRHVDDLGKAARLQNVQVERLLAEESQTQALAQQAVRKWRARYKYIPEQLETADILLYFEQLGTSGFEEIHIDLDATHIKPEYRYYTFKITGKASFTDLHRFVWHLENNREFYHVRNLSMRSVVHVEENRLTGVGRMMDVVQFSMDIDAFFAGARGLSASLDELAQVPEWLLPIRTPAHNSFYPVVRTDLPNNDQLLVNVQTAKLVMILGDQAVIEDERGQHQLRVGDPVYLGTITGIDPIRVVVAATLNMGGVTKVVELRMDTVEPHERAHGNVRLNPIREQ